MTWKRLSLVRSMCDAVSAALAIVARYQSEKDEEDTAVASYWDMALCCLSSWTQTIEETRNAQPQLDLVST